MPIRLWILFQDADIVEKSLSATSVCVTRIECSGRVRLRTAAIAALSGCIELCAVPAP
ncbi:hypothetical protein BN970_04983 [Mycolicibacterium conceptionense]|uniref:Uncharacterized protein n=1 Tax=Mycolicibacterium conceptionense TaxID=451644 RepID=A0A0U1DT53_9MYCO|nr:hypothetical protein BN970_04983 [Mycolicibacterium conceptionense]